MANRRGGAGANLGRNLIQHLTGGVGGTNQPPEAAAVPADCEKSHRQYLAGREG